MTMGTLGQLNPRDLPSPPDVALRLVKACADPDISAPQLQKIIGQNATLVAELLRMVNSPLYGLRQPVTKLNQAIMLLGQDTLRHIALMFLARETVRAHPIPNFDLLKFWDQSLRRAVSARSLAEAVGADAEEAFTLGLLQDLGLLALFIVYPHAVQHWDTLCAADPDERYHLEQELFGITHDKVGQLLGENWHLPEELTIPWAAHHCLEWDDQDPGVQRLARIAACSDWMAAVYSATDKRLALVCCRRRICETLGVDQHRIDALLAALPKSVEDAALALGVNIGRQSPLTDVLADANRRLVVGGQGEGGHARLETALAARERLAEELLEAYERVARLAFFDPLTRLVNRRRFEDLFCREVLRHGRAGQTLSVVALDIDHFKTINDTHGHALGDAALAAVSDAVRATLRASDAGGRLGGDELCLLLPDTSAEGGKTAAERLRASVEGRILQGGHGDVRLTVSLGGSTWHGSSRTRAAADDIMKSLLEAADKALYLSKNSGRNQVNWVRLN